MAESESSGGGGGMDAFWAIVVVIVLFIVWIQGGGPARSKEEGLFKKTATSTSSLSSSRDQVTRPVRTSVPSENSSNETVAIAESKYKGLVRLQRGTAASTNQPNREYITILANYNNSTPIKVGGWVLSNGRSEHYFDVSGNEVRGQSVYVTIPEKGIALYNPYQPKSNILVPITLKSGESAVITTGQIPTIGSVTMKDNFKINRCLGYLADSTSYQFTPSLYYRCPNVSDMFNTSDLSDTCYDFARSISACHEPKEYYVQNQGYCLERNCRLNSSCQGLVKKYLNFQSCFNQFSHDKDFVGPEWRVFLGRPLELWANRRETISLFDSTGKLVDKISY